MIKKFNLLFVTSFNIGKIKYAPGTFASLFTCIFFYFLTDILNLTIILFFTFLIFLYSLIAINSAFESFESEDPPEIVVDEVVGQLLPLLAIPIYETLYPAPKIQYCIATFLFFRLFDIWKPFPINYIDKNMKGSLGIMLDDIVAGIYTIIIFVLVLFFIGA